jgi:hypothetical protein
LALSVNRERLLRAESAVRVGSAFFVRQLTFIDFMTIKNAIPKFVALILVSICVAFIMRSIDATVSTKLDSMSAADYVQHQRGIVHHSFAFHFIIWLIIGGLYIASVEFIAYVIGLCFKKHAA